ncbi:MAG: hypothetical protein OXC37_04590 [Bdellovibrionaceae bacterium]|nr:hypothetical protein [Pseudobdellovibrionaceae bacterium]
MKMMIKLIFVLLFLFVSCSGDEEKETLYTFPSLSQGQLIEIKKTSEKMEGFFITTDLSDLDPSWAERGYYLYVCIRFLNDSTVNKELKKSAIPLLVQVSTHEDKPTAESVVLLHPQTMRSGEGVFYYEERQLFPLTDSSIVIRDVEYNIFDMIVNSKGKITRLNFVRKDVKPEQLDKRFTSEDDDEEEEEEEEEGEDEEEEKNLFLEVTSFAKQFSSSCNNWSVLNYEHSTELPTYLQTGFGSGESESDSPNENNDPSTPSQDSKSPNPPVLPIQPPAPIPDDTPYVLAPQ